MKLKKGKFRIINITRFVPEDKSFETLGIEEGLYIDITPDNGNSYFAIAAVSVSKNEIEIREIGTRVIDYVEPEDYALYRQVLRTAVEMVKLAIYHEENYD